MTPGLRKKNEKRGRRAWAVPFVLTLALSPAMACSSKEKPETRTHNPPMPGLVADAGAAVDKSPPTDGTKVVPDSTAKPKQQFARIFKLDNGECRWAYPSNCAPNEKCNPPEPAKIECPKFISEKGAHGIRNADGTCSALIEADCPKPVSGTVVPCNPPAPQKVDCPE